MSYEDDEEMRDDFRKSADDDEPLEVPEEITDFGLEEEDPDKDR